MLKKILIASIAAGAALASVSAADAAGGCGPGFHRGPYGGCRANYGPGPGVVVAPGVVIGGFYPGRGIGTATAIGVIATPGMAAGAIAEPTDADSV